ncbi:hypothetical protein COUCH_26190 [Couchioplanes caeruleus]|uniref:hypothetical protein n=1 Tax=Couchioplanes caeruleus TaxID=56438 RepID=UPI0020C0A485|nr:hypothetical protein [Couchioplanes caeruleus]UQU62511.1 hypothetical protein COUCH_26190 [Couchioplanes caeruleus]
MPENAVRSATTSARDRPFDRTPTSRAPAKSAHHDTTLTLIAIMLCITLHYEPPCAGLFVQLITSGPTVIARLLS